MSITVSLIVPCYNEVRHIKDTIRESDKALKETTEAYEILIIEDGSTDGTSEVARKIAANDPHIHHIHSENRLGKGAAIKKGFNAARGEILVFIDADSSVSPSYLPRVIEYIRQGNVICIGKRDPQQRKTHRKIASTTYNWITRRLLGTSITDHQCGLKAFKAETIHSINAYSNEDGYLWDTEVLTLAHRHGVAIMEIPVDWTKQGKSSLNLLTDPVRMLKGLLRIRKHMTQIQHNICPNPWSSLDYSAEEKTAYTQRT